MANMISGVARSRFLSDDFPEVSQNPIRGLSALSRGGITEIIGESASGRTAIAHSMLATATAGGEVVAVIDSSDAFNPASAQSAGVDPGKLLWVQCGHRLEAALKAADMVLHAGGFGLIVFDLCDVALTTLDRIPISCWHRFRRAVEHTPGMLLVLSRRSVARSCAMRQFELSQKLVRWSGEPPFQTIDRLEAQAMPRRPMPGSPFPVEVQAEE